MLEPSVLISSQCLVQSNIICQTIIDVILWSTLFAPDFSSEKVDGSVETTAGSGAREDRVPRLEDGILVATPRSRSGKSQQEAPPCTGAHKDLQHDKKELQKDNPCILFKEGSQGQECQVVVEEGASACETVYHDALPDACRFWHHIGFSRTLTASPMLVHR